MDILIKTASKAMEKRAFEWSKETNDARGSARSNLNEASATFKNSTKPKLDSYLREAAAPIKPFPVAKTVAPTSMLSRFKKFFPK